MSQTQEPPSTIHLIDQPSACPIHQKTHPVTEPTTLPVVRDEKGTWHIHGFEEARTILRSKHTRQAGFNAEQMNAVPGLYNRPILYQEGKEHQQQRKQTAQFFTPKTVSSSYRIFIEEQVDQLIEQIRVKRTVDLSRLSLTLAVQVASQVIGLTHSLLPGMERRLDVFFQESSDALAHKEHSRIGKVLNTVRTLMTQRYMLMFYLLDVRPAIRAHKRQQREDVISHLLGLKYSDPEILTECITYGAAGMATTREFISMAAWHLLEHPELRARYQVAPEEERFAILHETLRLEPVIGHLYRRTTAPLNLVSEGQHIVIPSNALVHLYIYDTNADEQVVGEKALELCPDRAIHGERIPSMIMSFGDGAHRCPGSYLAIQETDIFLQHLLTLDTLRIKRSPTLTYNEISQGYELRNFVLTLDGR